MRTFLDNSDPSNKRFPFPEAFAFIKKPETISAEAFDEKRKKLKQVIKSKIRKARSDQRQQDKPSKKRKV